MYLAEGTLATAQKRWPEAEAAFRQSVAINHQYHLPYYEARSLLEWGEMYLARGDDGDRSQGMELLAQALDIFQQIQAKKMMEKVLVRRLEIQGVSSTSGRSSIDSVASAVEQDRPDLRSHSAPEAPSPFSLATLKAPPY